MVEKIVDPLDNYDNKNEIKDSVKEENNNVEEMKLEEKKVNEEKLKNNELEEKSENKILLENQPNKNDLNVNTLYVKDDEKDEKMSVEKMDPSFKSKDEVDIITKKENSLMDEDKTNENKIEKDKNDIKLIEKSKDANNNEIIIKKESDYINDHKETEDDDKKYNSLNLFKSNEIKSSESMPTSPVVKKRKRGRPSRSSKSNTSSPSPLSPDSSGNGTTLPFSSPIDYSLYGMLRTSTRRHGTFEKKCVQCNAIISPKEYAKNGVVCGNCWKANFKD